jgi:hypothetical protein
VFDRLTQHAREVVVAAQAEARNLGQRQIGTEHLLLGILAHEDEPAAHALTQAGLSANGVRKQLIGHLQPGDRVREGEIPFTPRAKKALELALRESLRLGDTRVGTEHLLLGLTDLREGQAIRIMIALGTGPEAIRIALSELMQMPAGQAMVYRVRDSVQVRGQIADWVHVDPSEDLRRLLNIAAARASDSGRDEVEVADLVLAFTLRPGPATAAGLVLTFDESQAATERDKAWTSPAAAADHWAHIGPSDAARRRLMAAGATALLRGSSLIELSDLLLALLDDELSASLFAGIGLDPYRTKNSIKREQALASPEVA